MTEHSSTPSGNRPGLDSLDARPVPDPSTAVAAAGRRLLARRIGAAAGVCTMLLAGGLVVNGLGDRDERIQTVDVPVPSAVRSTVPDRTSTTPTTTPRSVTSSRPSSTSTKPSSTSTTSTSSTTTAMTSEVVTSTTDLVEETTTAPTLPTSTLPTTVTTAVATTQSTTTSPVAGTPHPIRFRAFAGSSDGSSLAGPIAYQVFWVCHLDSAGCTELDRASTDGSGYVTMTFDTTQEQMLFTDPLDCPGQSTALGPIGNYAQPAWVPSRDAPGGVLPNGALDRVLVAGPCEAGV